MSGEQFLRSKGTASQPNKVVTSGAIVKRCDFDEILGKSFYPTVIAFLHLQ